MVSDADGKHYPWYGAKNEVMQVCGPTQLPTPITVSMHDTVHPQVWLAVICRVPSSSIVILVLQIQY